MRCGIVKHSYSQDALEPHCVTNRDVTFQVDTLVYVVVLLVK